MKIKFLFVLILINFLFSGIYAHEYWIEAEKFQLTPNEKAVVHLYVGDGLIKDREERAFQSEKTLMFQLFSFDKTLNLKNLIKEESLPIYNFSADKDGTYLLAMERNWSYIKLEAEKFEDYLREDGMEYIIGQREKLGERKKEGSERYSRYLKSLLQVGGKYDDVYKKELGMKLEIIPLENPYAKKIGDNLKFQVLFDGKPLTNKVVFADNRNAETQKMTTDKNGKFAIKIAKEGMWLVRLVYMQRCKVDCKEADWESFWGAITFGI